jgi:hypothetical protein
MIATGLFVAIAAYVIEATVPASDIRDAVMLWMWPAGLVAAFAVAWRWLGSPVENAARNALTEVVVEGRRLRERLLTADEPTQEEQAAWKVRVADWYERAVIAVGRVAPDRQAAFRADPLYADHAHKELPQWKQGLLLDLDVRIDQLVVIRASL